MRSTRRMVEAPISGVEWYVVPGVALAAQPGERVVPFGRDRVCLRVLLGREVAVHLPVGAEVTAHRSRQETLLEAAHRRRRDQLVEARVALGQLDRPVGLDGGGAGAPVPEPSRLELELDRVAVAQRRRAEGGADDLVGR